MKPRVDQKTKDDTASGSFEKTDKCLEKCGTKALLKIISLMPGKDIEKQPFSKIKELIKQYVEPTKRLVIADRTNFMQMKQDLNETEIDYLSRLNDASVHCKWDELKSGEPSSELVKLRFIAGLRDEELKMKVLEKIQINPHATMNDIIDFCQVNSHLKDFVHKTPTTGISTGTSNNEGANTFASRAQAGPHRNTCSKCASSHKMKECPAYGKTCHTCGKPNHFAKCCRQKGKIRDKFAHQKKKTAHSVEVFHTSSVEKQGSFVTLSTAGTQLTFQLDSGAEISLMSETQWKQLGAPELTPTDIVPVNFDGSKMQTLGQLSISFDNMEKPKPLEFLVVQSTRKHGLIGRDLIDSTQSRLACTFAPDIEYLPPLNGFKASMAMASESEPLKFVKARKIPIHLKDQLDEELNRLQKLGIIEPSSFSNHASPVVWVKKDNGSYRMCVDYKATLNDNLQSDAYPMPSVEEIFSRIDKSVLFAKIDLTCAYWQIEFDEAAKKCLSSTLIKGCSR